MSLSTSNDHQLAEYTHFPWILEWRRCGPISDDAGSIPDYIKSCATIGVCRQIIFAMDTTMFGRLSFNDFKDLMCSLKLWQGVFKNHTKEKTGVLKAERYGARRR